MTRAHRYLLTAALGLVPGLLLAAARPADASGLRFLEVYGHDASSGSLPLYGAFGLALSPDGRHLYVAGEGSDAIVVFARDAASGRLAFVEAESTPNAFAESNRHSPRGVAVSPDGAHVYVVSRDGDALMVYLRDAASGALALLQVKDDGRGNVNGIRGAETVLVSPDGAHVYVAGRTDNAVAVFRRDAATGLVTFVEMKRDGIDGVDGIAGARALGMSPDGVHLYVAGSDDNAIAVFRRDATTGALTFTGMLRDGIDGVAGLQKARAVSVTPDGAQVLVAGGDADTITVFRRDAATGALAFLEAHEDEVNGVNGLNGPSAIAISPDGTRVYVTGSVDDSIAVFHRDTRTGALRYLGRERDGFAGVDGLDNPEAVVVSPDGTTVYATGSADAAVAAFRAGTCGDGFVDTEEECDDGNTTDGDCCSAVCEAEPAGGACLDDGNPCTGDRCNGIGTCVHPAKSGPCDDGAFCTVNDGCEAGTCRGAPRDCSATTADQCHQGACDEAANQCVPQPKADGNPCDDGHACTRSDACVAGVCAGAPVVCTARDSCHEAGACEPATGLCSDPVEPAGTACDDGDACTRSDTCAAGTCTGAARVVCTARDQCHQAGRCAPATGLCSNPARPDGSTCDDRNTGTEDDTCTAGACAGAPLADHDGVGDAFECSAPAPGRCIPGGGPAATDCLLEFYPSGPVTLNGKQTMPKGILRCTDGDPACDQDGMADGRCTFGVAVCLANADPRLTRCRPAGVTGFEVLAPKAGARSALDRANALAFEATMAAMGLEIRRQDQPVIAAAGPGRHDGCSALANLIVPAPARGDKPLRRTFRTRAHGADGRNDIDGFSLECRR